MDFFLIFIFVLLILFCANVFKAIITYVIEDYNIFFSYKKETTFKEEIFIEEKKIYILPYLLFVLYLGYFYISYSFLRIDFISKNDFYSYFLIFIWIFAFAYSLFSFKQKHITQPLILSGMIFYCFITLITIESISKKY
jgi:hypothetical protein